MKRWMRNAAASVVALAAVSCDSMGTESAGSTEHAWTNFGTEQPGFDSDSVQAFTADATYTIYAVIDEDGLADGILTITGDGSSAYDPYEVLIDGVLRRNGDGAPEHMLAEYDRYDGSRCRIAGPVNESGTWSAELGCEGRRADDIELMPLNMGIVQGKLTSDPYGFGADDVPGARVWACSTRSSSSCRSVTYTRDDGDFRFEIEPGTWWITFSVWQTLWSEWEYCAINLSSSARLAKQVTVRLGRVTDATMDCPYFN